MSRERERGGEREVSYLFFKIEFTMRGLYGFQVYVSSFKQESHMHILFKTRYTSICFDINYIHIKLLYTVIYMYKYNLLLFLYFHPVIISFKRIQIVYATKFKTLSIICGRLNQVISKNI